MMKNKRNEGKKKDKMRRKNRNKKRLIRGRM
jgi:hypothetical protein